MFLMLMVQVWTKLVAVWSHTISHCEWMVCISPLRNWVRAEAIWKPRYCNIPILRNSARITFPFCNKGKRFGTITWRPPFWMTGLITSSYMTTNWVPQKTLPPNTAGGRKACKASTPKKPVHACIRTSMYMSNDGWQITNNIYSFPIKVFLILDVFYV